MIDINNMSGHILVVVTWHCPRCKSTHLTPKHISPDKTEETVGSVICYDCNEMSGYAEKYIGLSVKDLTLLLADTDKKPFIINRKAEIEEVKLG